MQKRYQYLGISFIIGIFLLLFYAIWEGKRSENHSIISAPSQNKIIRTELAPEAVASRRLIGKIQRYYFTETGAKVAADPFAAIFTIPDHLKDFDHYIALLESKEQEGFRKLTFGAPSTIIKVELLTPEELEEELSHRDLKK